MKKCKLCNKVLIGRMLFYPKFCLSCVIDYHCKDKLIELQKIN